MEKNKGFHSYILVMVLLMLVLFAMNYKKFQENDYTRTQLMVDMEARL